MELIYGSYGGSGQPETDDFCRWCVYCGADCWPDAEYQEHADECPSITGKYPIKGEPRPHGPAVCARCNAPFGGHYRHVLLDEAEGEIPIYECVCDDCALAALIE